MRAIVAVDEKWGIGREGKLLCDIPGDLAHFKELTMGKTVVMGRVTLESLPGGHGLPDRKNIVLTRQDDYFADDVEVVSSEDELWSALTGTRQEDILVIGGGEIYEALLPFCDLCYVTKIYGDLQADRFFPNLDEDKSFVPKATSDVIEENGIRYQFFEYLRVGEEQ